MKKRIPDKVFWTGVVVGYFVLIYSLRLLGEYLIN